MPQLRGHSMRLATLNCQNLGQTLAAVLDVLVENQLDVLCLQECIVKDEDHAYFIALFRRHGLTAVFGPYSHAGGLCIISRCVLTRCSPDWLRGVPAVALHRCLCVRLCRRGGRPLYVINVHLQTDAAARKDKQHLVDTILNGARCCDEDWITLGDWNMEAHEHILGKHLGRGDAVCADAGFDAPPTRKHGTRTIDYAVGCLRPTQRHQLPGPRDHYTVAYDYLLRREVRHTRPAFARLPVSAPHRANTTASFLAHFDADRFETLLRDGCTSEAWTLLSDAAESALCTSSGRSRADCWKPHAAHMPSKVVPIHTPLQLRKLLRCQRQFDELRLRESRRLRASLAGTLEEILKCTVQPWSVESFEALLRRETEDAQTAFTRLAQQRARALLEDNIQHQRKYIRANDAPTPPVAQTKEVLHNEEQRWLSLWNSPHHADDCGYPAGKGVAACVRKHQEAMKDMLSWVPPTGYECPTLKLTADGLRRRAAQMADKAPGRRWLEGTTLALVASCFLVEFSCSMDENI